MEVISSIPRLQIRLLCLWASPSSSRLCSSSSRPILFLRVIRLRSGNIWMWLLSWFQVGGEGVDTFGFLDLRNGALSSSCIPTIFTSAPICFSFIPSAFRFVSISVKYSHQRNVSVRSSSVWDEMSFGWPSDGNKPIKCAVNSVKGMKTKYCKEEKKWDMNRKTKRGSPLWAFLSKDHIWL